MWVLGLALAAEPPADNGPATERVEYAEVVLASQQRVLVVRQPTWKTVSLATVIDGGLVAEPRAGLSRALADGWMASSPTGSGAVRDLYERLGAEADVRVEPESTVFWVHGPADATETLLALEKQRFTDPLARLSQPAAPTRPTARQGFTARYLEVVDAGLFPEPHPYHAIWRSPSALEHPVIATAELASDTWTPARTTLVVAGPVEPQRVLCSLDATRCGQPVETRAATARVELPDASERWADGFGALTAPLHPDIGPVSAGIPADVVLLAWSLPGLDSGTGQIARLVRDRITIELHDDKTLPGRVQRCHLFEGRRSSSLICTLDAAADTDLDRFRRRLRRGWPTREIPEVTASWRSQQLGSLLGASGEAAHVPLLAEHLHHARTVSVHGGELEALAFDADDVTRFLQEVVTEERLLVVRLVP